MYATLPCLLGSLLLVAGCATDPDAPSSSFDRKDTSGGKPDKGGRPTKPDPRPDPAPATTECGGETVDDPNLIGSLDVGGDDLVATVAVTNTKTTEQLVDVTLHAHGVRGLERTTSDPVLIGPGTSVTLSFVLADLGVTGTSPMPLKAELVSRDASGAVIERAFVHGQAGPTLAVATAQYGIPTLTLDGEIVALGAIVEGGLGIDPGDLGGANDNDSLFPPVIPPSSPFAYNMCFRWPVSLIDAGFGESYGVDPTDPWRARGGRVTITQAGQTLFDDYLDGAGCTGQLVANGGADFTIIGYSQARVAGNDLIVRDAAQQIRSFAIANASPHTNQAPMYVFPEIPAVSNLLAVSAYTMQNFNGGMIGRSITANNRCRLGGNQCCNCSADDAIWVTSADRKFLIGHELGHRLLSLYIGNYDNNVSFDLFPGTNAGAAQCDTSTQHSMWSMENESGAAMEGWAHFVAVAVFNDPTGPNPGAIIRYWSANADTTVDVEDGPDGGAAQYFDSVCPTVQTTAKLSVQLDWLRHWWDYHTNAGPNDAGIPASHKRMMDEMNAATPWAAGTALERIREGVQTNSGDDQLARWDALSVKNGID